MTLLWFLAGLVTVVTLFALVLNVGFMSFTQTQLNTAAESAALASTPHLMDRSILYNIPSLGSSSATVNSDLLALDQVRRARARAMAYAAENFAAAQAVALDENTENDPAGDIVIGWVDDPGDFTAAMNTWTGNGPFNSMVIRARRTNDRGNGLSLWVSSLFSTSEVDVMATARASIDQRIYGLRPVSGSAIPVMPIAIDPTAWLEQCGKAAQAGLTDRFAIDLENGSLSSGSDQIPEVHLELPSVGGGNCRIVPLANLPSGNLVAAWIAEGLISTDLVAWGGELSVPSSAPLSVAGDVELKQADRTTVRDALLSMRSVKRVFPLGWENSHGVDIVDFTAGSVVDCYIDDEQTVHIWIQPCVLTTRTALVRAGQPLNPWIGKLVLTR